MTQQDGFDRFIERAARDYRPPPETPREAMWAAIRAELGDAKGPASRRAHERWRGWRGSPSRWGLGLAVAATLVVGFALGRITLDRGLVPPGGPAGVPGATTAALAEAAAPSMPVRVATARHMGQAEAMLTLFRTADRDEDRAATAEWARELLLTTRLMLDSSAGDDAQLRQLLGDLELVLVQIVHAGTGDQDAELIERGLEERQLMTKLRVAASDPLSI